MAHFQFCTFITNALNKSIHIWAVFYRIQANQDLLTNRCTSITQQVYGQLTWPLGISEIGLQTNCQHGASKSKADKMQGLQITAFKKKKIPATPAQRCERRHLSCKNCWMCDKYSITINELYSPLEWFVIEKMLAKKNNNTTAHKHLDTQTPGNNFS